MTKRLQYARDALALMLLLLPGAAAAQDLNYGRFNEKSGEAIFKTVCQACHMPNAMGAVGAGAYPRLAGNPKLAEPGYPVTMVMNGRKAMPGFADKFDNVQIANVVNYVRTHFGNHYTDAVTPAFVASARPAAVKTGNAHEHK